MINSFKLRKKSNFTGAKLITKDPVELFQGTAYTLKFNLVGKTLANSAYANYRTFSFFAFMSGSAVDGIPGDEVLHSPLTLPIHIHLHKIWELTDY